MDQINSFLDRYKGLKLKDIELKEFVCALVKKDLGIDLEPKQISRSGFNLKIKVGALEKGEIVLHKKTLLKSLQVFKIKDLI